MSIVESRFQASIPPGRTYKCGIPQAGEMGCRLRSSAGQLLYDRFVRDDLRPPESNPGTYVAKTDCCRTKRLAVGCSAPYKSGGSASGILQVADEVRRGGRICEERPGAFLRRASRGRGFASALLPGETGLVGPGLSTKTQTALPGRLRLAWATRPGPRQIPRRHVGVKFRLLQLHDPRDRANQPD